jgi:Fe-S cluster assembly scaffold protein SufB
MFNSGLRSFPDGNLSGVKALYLGDFKGDSKMSLKGAFIGVNSRASGTVHLELRGVNFVKRKFTVDKGDELRLDYVSKDSVSIVEDVIYLGEGSKLTYDGRFKIRSGEFTNIVRVVHEKPAAASEVNIRGLVRGKATVLPTGEFLPGSASSTTSINGFVVMFGKGKVNAVPELLINDPATKACHSFKKLQITPEQLFYLASRGLGENNIEALYEGFVLGG